MKAYAIGYPDERKLLVGVVSHSSCGPNDGYAMHLDRIAEDIGDWVVHLEDKTWGQGRTKDILYDAMLIHRPDAYRRYTGFTPATASRAASGIEI